MLVTRRHLVVGAAAVAGVSAAQSSKRIATSAQSMGPFYPVVRPTDHDADLTRRKGARGTAAGRPINVIGRLVDLRGNPIRGGIVELWQANAVGRYDHPGDAANPAALDPNFQGFARLSTDRDGMFKFRSIKPAAYNTPIGMRTPHIHFDIRARTRRLTTQMYFPGEALNANDALLRGAESKESLIAEATGRLSGDPRALAYRWTVVLGLG
ncbi:MAG TPA: protocatechuate 3,4-dioxygenase [Sphingomicrobium sp.]|nr:protocatechuate 3,4-dioxygenase [Sphingomicrobium sp.]